MNYVVDKQNHSILLKPELLAYVSGVKYLTEYYAYRKSIDTAFSYECWAQELSYKSRSSLRMISCGERIISEEFVDIFSKKNSFSDDEKKYFLLLAKYESETSSDLKKAFLDKILERVRLFKNTLEMKEYSDFLSSSAIPILQLIISFADFKATESNLRALLHDHDRASLTEGLNILERLGMVSCVAIEQDKLWISRAKYFNIPDNILDEALNTFHKESTKEANRILDLKIINKRFKSVYFSLTEEKFLELAEDFDQFLSRITNKYGNEQLQGKKLYKVNLQTYPVTQEAAAEAEIDTPQNLSK